MMSHGRGMRTTLVSATRGDGGQNEIGPEIFQALGVLRTEELLAVHRFDGAEQYFTGRSISATRSVSRSRSRSGDATRSSATTCATSGTSGPTSSLGSSAAAVVEVSIIRPPRS